MSIFFKLTASLLKTVEPTTEEKHKRKIFYIVMSLFAIFGIMLPMAFFVGVIIYYITSMLADRGAGANGIEMFLHLVSIFSFIFGINVIFSVFYFSSDVESLLPLPLKPHTIIGSKFTAALISESVMEFVIILAAFAGYIIASGAPFYSWIIALFGMMTLPIIPLIDCGIICMLMMLVTSAVRNKDTVNKLTGILTFAAIIIIAVVVSQNGGFNTEKWVEVLSVQDNAVICTMNFIFPQIPLIVNATVNNPFVNLLFYIAVNAAAIGVFLLTARLLYFRTVVGISSGHYGSGKSIGKSLPSFPQRKAWVTYLKKEFRILFRTPAYFMNCVLINLLWPIFLYIVYLLQGQTSFLNSFIYDIHNGKEEAVLIYLLGITAVSVLVTAANCIASSALTREGKHFAFVKYIPMSYMAQLNVKALVSMIISGTGMAVYVVAASLYLNMGMKLTVFGCLLSLLCVAFATYLGIFMDSVNPKLVWDDELNALRGNYYIFFNMAAAILLEAVICTGVYLLFRWTDIGALMLIIALPVLFMILTAASYLLCSVKATKNIDSISF